MTKHATDGMPRPSRFTGLTLTHFSHFVSDSVPQINTPSNWTFSSTLLTQVELKQTSAQVVQGLATCLLTGVPALSRIFHFNQCEMKELHII